VAPAPAPASSPSRCDVLIVGGGLAGASLAVALGGAGFDVVVAEAASPGDRGGPPGAKDTSYDDRSVALAYGSRRIFDALGVWPLLDTDAVASIERIHISDRGHFGFTHLDRRDAGLPALGYVVENRGLGAALYAALNREATVRVLAPARVEDVRDEGGEACALIECAGEPREVRAALVVLADGGRSPLRERLGIDTRVREYGQTAVVTNVTPARFHEHTAYERFTPGGPLALLPLSRGRCSVVWTVRDADAAALLDMADGEFADGLAQRFGDRMGEFVRVGARSAYPLRLSTVREDVHPRLALVGNAAHTLHPVAGQGFNLGLRDVAVLAQCLAEARARGEDPGGQGVLQRYSAWRRRDHKSVTTFTDGLVRIFSNEFPPLGLARNLGLIAVDLLPPVKRALVRLTSGVAGRQPRLASGLPLTP